MPAGILPQMNFLYKKKACSTRKRDIAPKVNLRHCRLCGLFTKEEKGFLPILERRGMRLPLCERGG